MLLNVESAESLLDLYTPFSRSSDNGLKLKAQTTLCGIN